MDSDGVTPCDSTQLAKDTGLGRESLHTALAPGAKPRYDTIMKIMHALGVKLTAVPGRA
jgi:probable addiction module antidote protein